MNTEQIPREQQTRDRVPARKPPSDPRFWINARRLSAGRRTRLRAVRFEVETRADS
ncbi:MAG: hypothetical protein IH889_06555 [Planctomycetes bacterium]|nr:hypothetical protein [Planctomycetota bacterium]